MDHYQVIPQAGDVLQLLPGDGVDQDPCRPCLDRHAFTGPFVHHHIAVMPDVHWGLGATVGSVIPCKGAIVPPRRSASTSVAG